MDSRNVSHPGLYYCARILVQVTMYHRLRIGRDSHLDQSEACVVGYIPISLSYTWTDCLSTVFVNESLLCSHTMHTITPLLYCRTAPGEFLDASEVHIQFSSPNIAE